ncbi:SIMPL domain-containing protein [Tunicatimonas pelagia]|uniref:SIMPL domain-containing protein n=1 Tax=Tunicatimonas pelagia TaxID=931531 RepID=UPI0026659803|nr:SIMPL domain-containing protein [Tunicatimonas pelagia]WKN42706.1 SIMPL domain-containing protein [Tunicatimonas pelagia]
MLHYLSAIILLFCVSLTSFAQSEEEPMVKKIEVTGQAEEEVVPDEIYFAITLKEYLGDNKKKVVIDKLERELYQAVRKVGVAEEDLRVEDIQSYNYNWYRRNRPQREEFLASKKYTIKFEKLDEVNDLFAYLDAKGIQSTDIDRYDHSRRDEFERDLKIKALQNAKEKAKYLLNGIDENLGGVLEVTEINTGNQSPTYYREMSYARMDMAEAESSQDPSIEFQKIKLRYEVRAVFEIR